MQALIIAWERRGATWFAFVVWVSNSGLLQRQMHSRISATLAARCPPAVPKSCRTGQVASKPPLVSGSSGPSCIRCTILSAS